jgi:5-bromo-4-chloroindolyl phosphate hydrolysis protein
MGARRWQRILQGVEMARIKLSSDPNMTEYLSVKDWDYFQKKLNKAKTVCERLAREYKARLFRDSRWPATGIEIRRFFKCSYIRITLNPKYLEDRHNFFELREHSVISIFGLFNKLIENKVVTQYEFDQIENENLLSNDIKRLLAARYKT